MEPTDTLAGASDGTGTKRKRKSKKQQAPVEPPMDLALEHPAAEASEQSRCKRRRKSKKQAVTPVASTSNGKGEPLAEPPAEARITRKRRAARASHPSTWSMQKRRRAIKLSSNHREYEPEPFDGETWGNGPAWDSYAAACTAADVYKLALGVNREEGDGEGPNDIEPGASDGARTQHKRQKLNTKENPPVAAADVAPAEGAEKKNGRSAEAKALLSRKSCAYVRERNKQLKAGATAEAAKEAGRLVS